MKLPIAYLREEIFISIVCSRVNISRRGSLPGITSSVLKFFLLSRSHLLNIIAGGRIMLNFLCGLKAKDAMAPRIQKKRYCGIYFGRKMHYEIDEIFRLRDPFGNSHTTQGVRTIASSIRKHPDKHYK